MIFSSMCDLVEPLVSKIHHHPFNRELAEGTLPQEKFIGYVLQDALYLNDFAKALAMAATRLPADTSAQFLRFALNAIEAEQGLHRDYLRPFNINMSDMEKNPACFMYTHYLLSTATLASVEEAVASVLPCFWIYQIVGARIALTQVSGNPYQSWIDMYSSEAFEQTVNAAIQVMNLLAEEASPALQNKMIMAFKRATELEWLFWDDAYHQKVWGIERGRIG
ncbi:MAG: thiaminase II [Legionellaceae bacterium]|nr:thiaminase II [Legionellaceae bacterium]